MPKSFQIDPTVKEAIIGGINGTFNSMLGVDVSHVDLAALPDGSQYHLEGRVGMVQEDDQTLQGSMACLFPKEAIFYLLKQVYGYEFNEINKSVSDGVGEITNVIYAHVKKNLNELGGYEFKMAVPEVNSFEPARDLAEKGQQDHVFYFKVGHFIFSLKISIKSKIDH